MQDVRYKMRDAGRKKLSIMDPASCITHHIFNFGLAIAASYRLR